MMMHVGMRADHAQRATVGGARYHAAAVQDPAPLAIVLTQPELGYIGIGAPVQMRLHGRADLRMVVRMDQPGQGGEIVRQRLFGVTQHAGPAFGAVHHVGGDVPVPEPVVGAVQADFPAAGAIGAQRLGNTQGEGHDLALLVADRAQPPFQAPTTAARQHARRHAAAFGDLGTAAFQHFGVCAKGCRQSEGLRDAVGRQGLAMRIQQHHR